MVMTTLTILFTNYIKLPYLVFDVMTNQCSITVVSMTC